MVERVVVLVAVMSLGVAPGCQDERGRAKAEKEEAKRARDAELLNLAYPPSSGTIPASMSVNYDAATDRTTITLNFAGLAVQGKAGATASSAALSLTSSHRGRSRAADNPEGSVDGSLVVACSSPGVMAFSGPPGQIVISGVSSALKEPSKLEPYTSTRVEGAWEEVVRFRVTTESLVQAAGASEVVLEVGSARIGLTSKQIADLREFAARLKPGR
jgi:hypothetical protein